jgi:hypothetical protein
MEEATTNTETPANDNDAPVDNVVQFPVDKWAGPPQTLEETRKAIQDSQLNYINSITVPYAQRLMMQMGQDGVPIHTQEFAADFAFVVEAMRSCLYRTINIDHPMQETVDKLVDSDEVDLVDIEDADDDDFPVEY